MLGHLVPTADDLDPSVQLIVDGTLLPCWSWAGHPQLWSGKHRATRLNVQVAAPLSGHAALAVSREIQNRTGLAIRNVLRQLRPLRSATIAINGTEQTFPPAVPADKQPILDALRQRGLRH